MLLQHSLPYVPWTVEDTLNTEDAEVGVYLEDRDSSDGLWPWPNLTHIKEKYMVLVVVP